MDALSTLEAGVAATADHAAAGILVKSAPAFGACEPRHPHASPLAEDYQKVVAHRAKARGRPEDVFEGLERSDAQRMPGSKRFHVGRRHEQTEGSPNLAREPRVLERADERRR